MRTTFGLFQSTEEKKQALLDKITTETNAHRLYLSSIQLGDRAEFFKVKEFVRRSITPNSIDLSRFDKHMPLPEVVDTFDCKEPNTLFVHTDASSPSQQDEITRSLDIRLYPTIRRMIKENSAAVFLGSVTELQAYTDHRNEQLSIEIEVPSSVKFYIALTNHGTIKIYISGLVGYENLIQQLITLKLADIDPKLIPIIGNTEHYSAICKQDLLEFKKQAKSYLAARNVLVIAGCQLEEMATETLNQIFVGNIRKNKFSGDLVSLTYVRSEHAPDIGFIVLDLNYGEICEAQVSTVLDQFNCISVFTGSAAGYIPHQEREITPKIGARLPILTSRHHSGEVVALPGKNDGLHLQVPTIFVETYSWLEKARQLKASTVDVETFYILRAIKQYQQANPQVDLHIDVGVFVSDYVGETPLRNYQSVFAEYPKFLNDFVQAALARSLKFSYSNNRNSTPCFSSDFLSLDPSPKHIDAALKTEAVVDSVGKYWDKSEFSKRVHTPVTIGTIENPDIFANTITPRCLHLPIKLPGSDIRIPAEYRHFLDTLEKIFNFEISINPQWNNLYAYLTVDQGEVPRSNSQRVPGPHVDGMPRDRANPESQLIDHAYLATNAIPTMFYTQQFDMDPYDPNKHHFFAIFRALSDESRTIMLKPFDIVLMDAYSVHTPTQTQETVFRTFIRLEFSTLKFDRVGNSVNPHFVGLSQFPDYPFHYVPRPIPDHLFVPPSVYLNKPITNHDFKHHTLDAFGRANLRAVYKLDPRFISKRSDYLDLDLIAEDIMNPSTKGVIVSQNDMPLAFLLYRVESNVVKLHTMFTLSTGIGQEIMIYAMTILQSIADRFSLRAGLEEGETPITVVETENNKNMLKFFLRAARLAKIELAIERLDESLQPAIRLET